LNKVTVDYNPYLPELKVFINERTISKFSSITAYKNMPFVEWCERFFSEIHREVNDTYELLFVGTDFEAEIIQKLAEQDFYCKSFTIADPQLNQSIFDRLAIIEKITGESNCELTVRLFSDDDLLLDAMLDILDENGTFSRESDESANCADCPLVNIDVKKVPLQDFFEQDKLSLNLVVTTQNPDDDMIERFDNYDATTFIFYIGSTSDFIGKSGNTFIYSVDADSLSDYLLKIIVGYKLCAILSEKSYQIQKDIESNRLTITDNEFDLFEKVCLTQPIYKVDIPKEFYKGRSIVPKIKECPEINDNSYYATSDHNNVIQVDGINLKAVDSGSTEIKIFKENCPEAIFTGEIKVSDAVLIDRIEIFPKYKGIREHSEDTVDITTYPENAVNKHEIKLTTSDSSIAQITEGNTISGVSCGCCDLIVTAGDIVGKAQIEVMPPLEDIICPTSVVNVTAGEQIEWKYALTPENCYERDLIKIWSSDESVAGYMGGYIIGKNPGTANISIYTPDNRIKKNCHVTVSKKKLFR